MAAGNRSAMTGEYLCLQGQHHRVSWPGCAGPRHAWLWHSCAQAPLASGIPCRYWESSEVREGGRVHRFPTVRTKCPVLQLKQGGLSFDSQFWRVQSVAIWLQGRNDMVGRPGGEAAPVKAARKQRKMRGARHKNTLSGRTPGPSSSQAPAPNSTVRCDLIYGRTHWQVRRSTS